MKSSILSALREANKDSVQKFSELFGPGQEDEMARFLSGLDGTRAALFALTFAGMLAEKGHGRRIELFADELLKMAKKELDEEE